jgi:hypothetical protein
VVLFQVLHLRAGLRVMSGDIEGLLVSRSGRPSGMRALMNRAAVST